MPAKVTATGEVTRSRCRYFHGRGKWAWTFHVEVPLDEESGPAPRS